MTVLILSIVLVGIAIAGIAIKMFLQKDGQFSKTCSIIDTTTGKKIGCTCGADGDETQCDNYEKHHGVLKDS